MPKPSRNFRPLTDVGVQLNIPQYARKWQALDNTYVDQGRIRKRPGLRVYGSIETVASAGVPTALIEVPTNQETLVQDRLTPDSTSLNTTWTITGAATVHAAIDEDPADDAATMVEADTNGDKFRVGFSNTSNLTDDYVGGFVILGRARNTITDAVSTLKVSYFDGIAEYELGSVEINASSTSEAGDIWQDFAIPVLLNPTNGARWSTSEIDGLQ